MKLKIPNFEVVHDTKGFDGILFNHFKRYCEKIIIEFSCISKKNHTTFKWRINSPMKRKLIGKLNKGNTQNYSTEVAYELWKQNFFHLILYWDLSFWKQENKINQINLKYIPRKMDSFLFFVT